MAKNNDNAKAIERIEETINKIKNNQSVLYFFIVDAKNIPNGNIAYIYDLAKCLYDKKYNVKMIYQLENEYTESELYKLRKKEEPIDNNRVFQGVREWLGDEYADLPHMNISTEQWSVSPCDFLFIPEVFSSLMFQTYKYKAPCKRYVILQNYNFVTEFIPLGVEWKNYGIYDAIVSTEEQSKLIKNVFPYMRTKILNPYINDCFRKPLKPKNLIINIISKNQSDVNRIIKPFYWKYPIYKFVSFRDLRNFSRETYCDMLKESAITIWIDGDSPFGYSALEAMRCNNIVIGKIPERIPEWMQDENGLKNNGLWTYDIDSIPEILSKLLASWMQDEIPEVLQKNMDETNQLYTFENFDKNVEKTFDDIFNEHINDINELKVSLLNNIHNETNQ